MTYERGAGAEHCPDELALRNAVSARLGYDPFDEKATRSVAAAIVRRGETLIGRVEVKSDDDEPRGVREISSRQNDCTELSSALSLAISIAIDPLSLTRPPKAEPAVVLRKPQPSRKCPKPPPAPKPAPCEEEPSLVTFRASAGMHAALGTSPSIATLGMDIDAGLRWRALSIDVGGRADIPIAGTTDRGEVATSLLVATVAPCGHVSFFSGCALGAFGAMRGEHLDLDERETVPFVALGARAAAEVPVVGVMGVRVFGDLLFPLTSTGINVFGEEVWRAPVVQGAVGVAVMGDFP